MEEDICLMDSLEDSKIWMFGKKLWRNG